MNMNSSKLVNYKSFFIGWLCAAAGSVFLALTAYPGFMSYDSIHLVREARGTVEGWGYPTLPVYVFRLFDLFGNGNAIQFLIQNMIVLTCFNLILSRLRVSWVLILVANGVVLSNPLTMGAMLVLWKDVTLLAIALIVLLALVWRQTNVGPTKLDSYAKWMILVMIFLLGAMRLNALPLALGLFTYWTLIYFPHLLPKFRIALITTLTIGTFLFTSLLQTVGFPEMKILTPSTQVQFLMVYDLVGISNFAGESLVPFPSKQDPDPERIPISTIKAVYSNFGSMVMSANANALGLSFNTFPSGYNESDIRNAWGHAVLTYPGAYAQYRLDIFGAVIGTTVDRTFEPTHFNTIDENDLGITFKKMPFTDAVLSYIWQTSSMWVFMPATTWVIATLISGWGLVRRFNMNEVTKVALSTYILGLVYLLPYFLVAWSGEVRYAYPSTFLFALSMVLGLEGLRRSIRDRKSPNI